MGRLCTVCHHKEVDEINRLLLCSDSYRDIARQFGLSKDALARHKEGHIPELLSKSNDINEIINADSLLKSIQEESNTVRSLRDQAIAGGDIELALKAVDRALRCVDLCAKVRGIISDQPQVNVLVLPEWLALKGVIVEALRPHPQALEAVFNALP